MGNANTCRTLGIAPQAQIGSQEFLLLWDSYDKGQGFLTDKQARKFLKDFAEAVKMDSNRFELVADFVLRDLLNPWGRLEEEKFKDLFKETVKDGPVQLTDSLQQKLEEEDEVVDQEAMWRSEESKTIEERRRRYKCKANFTVAESITRWSNCPEAPRLQGDLMHFLKEEMELDEQDKEKERLKKIRMEQEEIEREERKKRLEQQKKEIADSESDEVKKQREKLAKKAKSQRKKQLENEEKRRARRKQLEELLNIKSEVKKTKQTKVIGASFFHEASEEKDDKGKEKEVVEQENSHLKNSLDVLPSTPLYNVNSEINNRVAVWKGDITSLELDAIVNAANKSCLGGGGVDGAIHSAAGRNLYLECTALHGCATGKSKVTKGYNLPAKHVIHTVGPILHDSLTREKEAELEQCYWNTLNLAVERGIKTLAFCGISTGIYGYPPRQATRTALNTVRSWLEKDNNYQKVDLVVFCQFLQKELTTYEGYMPLYFPVTEFQKNESTSSSSSGVLATTSTTTATTTSISADPSS